MIGQPLYLETGAGPVFAVLHPARGAVATLICPPFGWEDVSSYQSRREWARRLAAAGHPALRIDLPGSGDSGGSPHDAGRLEAWTDAVGHAAGWLRDATGCGRLVAIGIGLGGLLATRALAGGAPIDDLVLWAVPARGRTLVRELQAFAALQPAQPADAAGDALAAPNGAVTAGGFLLAPETVEALRAVDLERLALPGASRRRVLLLGRDGIDVDARVRGHFEASGAAVTVADGKGYAAMMDKPHEARPPLATFVTVAAWLAEAPNAGPVPAAARPRRADAAECRVADGAVRESPFVVAGPSGDLFGILAEPTAPPAGELTAVLLNAGAIRRIGPNRMWVEAARRWASQGIPTLRLDLGGIGDADGDPWRFDRLPELYAAGFVRQVRSALDALEERRCGRRFVLGGLCSGAYWALEAALEDERVAAALMLNPGLLRWDPWLDSSRKARKLLKASIWRKAMRGEIRRRSLGRFSRDVGARTLEVLRRPGAASDGSRPAAAELDDVLDRLRDAGTRLQLVFSGEEAVYAELEREGRLARLDRWPNLEIELIDTPAETHTLQPLWVQRRVHAVLDRALTRELAGGVAGD